MCCNTISSSKFISFDTESDIQDNLTLRCTIIQIYSYDEAFIYFTQDKITPYEEYLKSLFNNSNIIKVGYGISQDFIKLGNHGININPTSCIDIQSIVGKIALDKFVLDKYNFKMSKISYGTMSRSEEILRYASYDVYFIY